jgi:biotin-independent malonate decarboxylase gamma subunit
MSTDPTTPLFGTVWFDALASAAAASTGSAPGSLRQGEIVLDGGETAALLAIVPDPNARFPRARAGEVGLEEGYALARAVSEIVEADASATTRRPIVTVIDVPSQAYGYVEELAGVHQALAASTNAYAAARLAGHPVISLVVGKAISGAFLATGLQANRIVALDHDGIAVQVMSKQSAARITRRTIEELDAAATKVPAMAYDGRSFAKLGALAELVAVTSPAAPTEGDLAAARGAVSQAVESVRSGSTDLRSRLNSDGGHERRSASILVRQRVAEGWNL